MAYLSVRLGTLIGDYAQVRTAFVDPPLPLLFHTIQFLVNEVEPELGCCRWNGRTCYQAFACHVVLFQLLEDCFPAPSDWRVGKQMAVFLFFVVAPPVWPRLIELLELPEEGRFAMWLARCGIHRKRQQGLPCKQRLSFIF